jgi:hypothetical protein
MAATLSRSPHALHAQTTTPIHNATTYEHGGLELHSTSPQPSSYDSAHRLPPTTSAIMDSEDPLTPAPVVAHTPDFASDHLSPRNTIDDDSNMEGAEGTTGSTSLTTNPWLQPAQLVYDGRVSLPSLPSSAYRLCRNPPRLDHPATSVKTQI